jgi:hypothetical protein
MRRVDVASCSRCPAILGYGGGILCAMAQTPREAFAAAGFAAPSKPEDTVECVAVEEIEPAVIVATLDPVTLREDSRVVYTQDPPVTRFGPFVCVAAEGNETIWAGLTFKRRPERLELLDEWRLAGSRRWRSRPQFLTDGASLWLGPKEAFSVASWREVVYEAGRPRLSADGLAAVRRKILAAWSGGDAAPRVARGQIRHQVEHRRGEICRMLSRVE